MRSTAACSASPTRSSSSRLATSRCRRRSGRACSKRASSTRVDGPRAVIVGLVGAGNMSAALARGWSAAETGPDQLVLSDVDMDRAKRLAEETRGRAVDSNRELAEVADVVVLATKPAALNTVAEEMRVTVADRGLPVVSILGATPVATIERAFGPGTAVLRFMPNVAAEVRAGTFCYAPGEALDERTERSLLDLFGLLGELVAVD